jgi:hypothetical protein
MERFFSTKSARQARLYKPAFCAFYRNRKSGESAAAKLERSRANYRGFQQKSGKFGEKRRISRRFILSSERFDDSASALARAGKRRPQIARTAFSQKTRGRSVSQLRISEEAIKALSGYEWAGNVRELENAIEYSIAICAGDSITTADLPPHIMKNLRSTPDRLPKNRFRLPTTARRSKNSIAATRILFSPKTKATNPRRQKSWESIAGRFTAIWICLKMKAAAKIRFGKFF